MTNPLASPHLTRIKKMPPFGRFMYYITERYNIRVNRLAGKPREKWTDDPILATFKFTNVRRAWDYTSMWLTQHWYNPHGDTVAAGMMAATARFFCFVPSLTAIGLPKGNGATGVYHWLKNAENILVRRSQEGHKVFTSAYMIAGAGSAGRNKVEWVINDILMPVHEAGILRGAPWKFTVDALHAQLHTYNGWGDFMTQEVVLDLMETHVLWNRPKEERLMYGFAGPGAMRGLNRVFGREVRKQGNRLVAQQEMQSLWRDLRDPQLSQLPSVLRSVLTVHDVEFNLCEFDKYERTLHGQGTPKQIFKPRTEGSEESLL